MHHYVVIVCLVLMSESVVHGDAGVENAIKFVIGLNGKIERDDNVDGKPVIGVDLTNKNVTDAGLKELVGLKQLQELDHSGTEVTELGLKELAVFKQLRKLELYQTKTTNAGLKELAALKQLQELVLWNTKVTVQGSRTWPV
jgi:hypothetical protein